MENGYRLPFPKGPCQECADKKEIHSIENSLILYCPHNVVLSSMDLLENGEPSGIWSSHHPLELTEDWRVKLWRRKH